ncbi:hypothetical protein [Aquimarina sp. RZ0]|uniref:hypothetical protein n=1 Tax=Aquimarina sp. RZ0 TaxID=2607730 RepID=UPI0011F11C9F|nr:hypothetical protein [Aquimarina sp. RZ0]KAA1247483.1 hypothetical protein F0000_03215 [Aquimarina sp. RZ0]
MANDLPNFERREVEKILDKAIATINEVISEKIKRKKYPNINWSQLNFNGPQLLNSGTPFFINDYNFKPTDDKQLTNFYGNMNGVYISPNHIDENGKLAAHVKNNIASRSQNTIGDVFLEHKSVPNWAVQRYSKNKGTRNFKTGKRSFVGFDIDNPGAKELYGNLLDEVIPLLKGKSFSKMGISLCNEPSFFTQTDTWNTGAVSDFTKTKFADWLIKKHGSIANVNSLWKNVNVRNFNDLKIDIPINKNLQGTPVWYDWVTFNQKRVTDWFTFLHNRIKSKDRNFKTHIKNMPWLWVKEKKGHGIDLEALTMLTDVIGNDAEAYNSYFHGRKQRWEKDYAFEWFDMSMSYDFMKSIAPNKPIFNTEVHYLSTVQSRDLKLKPEYARAVFWLAHMQGTTAGNTWVWGRNSDGSIHNYFRFQNAPKDYPGTVTQQPQILDAVTTTMIDLNSHANHIVALQKLEKPVRIFYSKTSAINKKNHMEHIHDVYEELFFEGHPIGFATEKILKNQKASSWKAIVIYNTKYATVTELNELQKYLDN